MKFCSFLCEHADNEKAQYAACLAVNGVYCVILEKVVEKGRPCPAEIEGVLPKEGEDRTWTDKARDKIR